MQQKIQAVIQKIIGDKNKCTLEKARVGEDGTYIGGPKFERHERAVHVIGAERAYTLGPSHERVPNRSAPHASGKIYEGEMDEHLRLQKEIIEVRYILYRQTIHNSLTI
jgi:hypothetical protein